MSLVRFWTGLAALLAIGLAVVAALIVTAPLAHAQVTLASYTLTWTAPGNDSLSNGPCAKYDFRWRQSAPTDTTLAARETWWAAASLVTGLPVPANPGTTQTVVVTGLASGSTYWFSGRAKDATGNWSGFGNFLRVDIADTIRPAPVILR